MSEARAQPGVSEVISLVLGFGRLASRYEDLVMMAAELLASLRTLRELPERLHWFCARQDDEDREDYDDETLPTSLDAEDGRQDIEKQKKIEAGRERKSVAIYTLQLFAVAEENEEALNWFKQHLETQLSRCDKCTMAYHRGKKLLMSSLREEYDDEALLQDFFQTIEAWDVERLEPKLEAAAQSLRSAPPDRRNLHLIDVQSVFAMWEVLSDALFLKHEPLTSYFNETFQLVQTNKLFRSPTFFPLLTAFLFDSDDFRIKWAVRSWSKMRKSPSPDEFNWAIRDPLLQAMRQASNPGFELDFVMTFWYGAKLIIESLDKNLITHSLRGMEVDLYRLALDHLQLDTPALRAILQVIQMLLVKSPEDFWSAMGVITPITLVQAIFKSPQIDNFMAEGDDTLFWTGPLIKSLKLASRPPACREAVSQLMMRLEDSRYPPHVRAACGVESLRIILLTLEGFVDASYSITNSVDRIVVAEALDIVGNHIGFILDSAISFPNDSLGEQNSNIAIDVLRNALILDSKSLKATQEALERGKSFHLEGINYSRSVWEIVSRHFRHNNVSFAANILLGIAPLIGLERFRVKPTTLDRVSKIQFNNVYGHLIETVSQIFGRLSEFESANLALLFQNQGCTNCLVGALFSAEQSIYQAAVDVTKQISGTIGRKEAISYLLEGYFTTAMRAFCWAVQLIKSKRTFASIPRMLKTCGDVLDILCDSQTGLLRRDVSAHGPESLKLVERFWECQWQVLAIIFATTETWGSQYDKETLGEFARDTIQYAERLFDQYSIFERATESSRSRKGDQSSAFKSTFTGRTLLEHPTVTMNSMVKWLRLRDDYLLSTLVSLVCKLLRRLGESGIKIGDEALRYVEDGAKSKNYRTVLTRQQKAELLRALDEHQGRQEGLGSVGSGHGKSVSQSAIYSPSTRTNGRTPSESAQPKIGMRPSMRPGTIDLDHWKSKATPPATVIPLSDDEDYGDIPDEDILTASSLVEVYKEQRAANITASLPAQSASRREKLEEAKVSFRQKREKEQAEKRRRDAAQIAIQRKKLASAGIAVLTAEEGSGLNGIGIKGKDHAPPQSSIMVSDESSSSDDDEDGSIAMFKMSTTRTSQQVQEYKDSKARALNAQRQKPVKKVKQPRSIKDQRARLAPDLTALHKTILGWDFFHVGLFPPNSERNDYSMVSSTFKSPIEYQATFESLLVLEAWQGFLKVKEEGNFKPFDIRVANRMTVDSFIEVNTSMTLNDGKIFGIAEADIILLSKSEQPIKEPGQPHCLARVHNITRKKNVLEISYRVNTSSPLVASLAPNTTIRGTKITSIIPLEREYGALVALQYYDLCDEIIKAKPSPLLEYSDRHLRTIQDNYNVNYAQAKAVASAIDNDAFTLIQGPPGSGKTKTIVAIVGAILTDTFSGDGQGIDRPSNPTSSNPPKPNLKKLLICAPSNAAVDELVLRFKEGVKTLKGQHRKLSVVRLGKSDVISASVRDVTLEELVKVRAGTTSKTNHGDEIHQLVKEHKAISEAINLTQTALDGARAQGSSTIDLSRQFDLQKRKRSEIGRRLDNLRDAGNTVARDAEINRRKIQQEILDGANIICSTLSGSGHEMMRNINIEFETVIIDEAAQSIELSALIPLKYGCSKCIMVGDPKQLPPTVLSREASRFQYEQSLFVRMQTNHPTYVHLLDTQYRMHPEISQYPSKAFYDRKLLDGENMAEMRKKPWHASELLGPYRFFDVQGQHTSAAKGHSLINIAEVNVALQLFERLTVDYSGYNFKSKVGIITPYKSQLAELKTRFLQSYGESILTQVEFNTTDAFQGRESEVIIFSCVRASPSRGIGFLADIRRMNVGLTRAKSSLWVLGNSQSLMHGEFWGNLIEDARLRQCYTNGDLMALLRKPMIKLAPVESPPGATSSNVQPKNSRHSSPDDVEMIDAPSTDPPNPDSAKPTFQPGFTDIEKRAQTQQPSCPPMGISCNICGSDAHYASDCTNTIAKAAALGTCSRCGDHHFGSCAAVLCYKCGKFGHDRDACTSSTPPSQAQREEIQRQIASHETRNKKNWGKMRKKRLGDHDPQVPIIRTTYSTQQTRNENRNEVNSNPRTDGKRKRGASPPEVLTVSGSSNTTPNPGPIGLKPTQDSPDSNSLDGQVSHRLIKPSRLGAPAAPRGPHPPRKKKEVDPFIRPNRKRPKP